MQQTEVSNSLYEEIKKDYNEILAILSELKEQKKEEVDNIQK